MKFTTNNFKSLFIIFVISILIIHIIVYTYCRLTGNKLEFFANTDYNVSPRNRRILMLYTGGTIGMVETKDGNEPKKGFLQEQFKKYIDIQGQSSQISQYDIKSYDPLLDSSNMSINDWNKIIKDINDNYGNYDGFIVIHGTDTLAYTASALSFALQNLGKPVVVTGSQIPLQKLKNDGYDNLLTALILVSQTSIPEVMVVFNNQVFRGNRSKKISSNKIDAFSSPNMPPLGNFGYLTTAKVEWKWTVGPNIDYSKIFNNKQGEFSVQYYNPNREVSVIFLTPGFNFKNVVNHVDSNPNISAVILQTFGIGDGPTGNKEFLDMLKALNDRGILILNISQCIEGHIDTGDYETGKTMKKYRVISGEDMTLEAGYAKLLYLLTKYNNNDMLYSANDTITNMLKTSIRGELSKHPTAFEM